MSGRLAAWVCVQLAVPMPASYLASDGGVGVLPVVVRGTSDEDRQRFEERIEDGLSRGEFEVVEADSTQVDGPSHFVQGSVSVAERDYTIELKVLDRTGRVVATSTEVCEICGAEEVESLISDQAASLAVRLESLVRGPASLTVGSTPAGARVLVDGELVGVTPFSGEVSAGAHTVRVAAVGHIPQERKIDAVQGVSEQLDFSLQAQPVTPRGGGPKPAVLLGLGGAGVGLGVALLAGGSTLVALHGRPYRGRCTGNDIDADGTCRYDFDTRAGGIASLVVGAGTLAAGIALIVIGTRRNKAATPIHALMTADGVGFRF